jgi:hypothetical protein
VVWVFVSAIAFAAFGLGLHDITYSPSEGVNKQVGFFWSASWPLEGFVLIPLYLINVTALVSFWKGYGRQTLSFTEAGVQRNEDWLHKIESYSLSYWGIFLISFLGIFALQWAAVYLRAFMRGSDAKVVVDWISVAIVLPDVTSIPVVFVVSIFAFFYSGVIYWLYFIGLLLLYTAANDFAELCKDLKNGNVGDHQDRARTIGSKLLRGIFRCTVFGIFLSISIKLNTIYLKSDTENIVSWLLDDALTAVGIGDQVVSSLNLSTLSSLTSLLLLFLTAFVFFACMVQILTAVEGSVTSKIKGSCITMVGVVLFLIGSFLSIGQFSGFTIPLFCSVLIATYSLIWGGKQWEK